MIGNRSTTSMRPSTSRPSTASMNSSMISTTRYPKCDLKKQHAKEVMNLICVSNNCKLRGPICSLCKTSQHSNHTVMPIRSLMEKLKKIITNPPKQQIKEQIYIEEETKKQKVEELEPQKNKGELLIKSIENCKNEMLAMLQYTIKQIATKISLIEQTIIKQTDSLIHTLETSLETEENIEKVVEQFLDSPPDETDLFKHKIKSILNIINIKSKDSIQIGNSYQQQIDAFKTKSDSFQSNIEDWMKSSMENLDQVFNINEKKLKVEATKNIKFSAESKSKSIVLSSENKVAKQTDGKLIGFVLTTGNALKNKSFACKIVNLSSNIKVGVCLKDIVKGKGYKLAQNAIGHGCYLLSNNSYVFSHFDTTLNMTMKGFNFQSGDIIEVSCTATEVKFQKRNSTSKATLSIKKLSEAQQKQLYFCVWLGGNNDKVEIIE